MRIGTRITGQGRMVMGKRDLFREAMSMQADEDRLAFIESLSPDERHLLWGDLVQRLNKMWDSLQPIYDEIMDFIRNVNGDVIVK